MEKESEGPPVFHVCFRDQQFPWTNRSPCPLPNTCSSLKMCVFHIASVFLFSPGEKGLTVAFGNNPLILRIVGKGPASWDHSGKTSGDQHSKLICTEKKKKKKPLLGGGCDENTLHTCMKLSKNKNCKKKKKTQNSFPSKNNNIASISCLSEAVFGLHTCSCIY